jgi:hypothetical protein
MTQECASLETNEISYETMGGAFGKDPTGSWPRRPSTLPRNAQALADIPAVGIWSLACQAGQHVSTSMQRTLASSTLTLVEHTYRQIHSSLSHCDLYDKGQCQAEQ